MRHDQLGKTFGENNRFACQSGRLRNTTTAHTGDGPPAAARPKWLPLRGVLVGVVVLLAGQTARSAQPWKPADAPLLTRWAKQVTPERVHQEYPRPQLVREDWLNLNGLWDYAVVPKQAPRPDRFDGKILVPFPIESALSGVGKRLDENSRLWYRRTFQLPDHWKGKRVLLHFGAVDWEATVYVDGQQVGTHRGGYDPFCFDVTDALKNGSRHELVVAVWDPTDTGGQPRGKQVHQPRGIWYTPSSGIWQTVWLEPVEATHVEQLRIVPLFDQAAVAVEPTVVAPRGRLSLTVDVLDGQRVVATQRVVSQQPSDAKDDQRPWTPRLVLRLPGFKPWSPDSPFLYDLRVRLERDGRVCDRLTSYFGMRKVSVGKDSRGITRILLNNRFVFQIGFLDQGFWPDGLYTAPTDQALRYDIEVTKKLGMNLARKHVKVEPDRWYYWCDRLGLLVWQDMPSGRPRSPEEKEQFERELRRLVQTHWNHPSIVMWVVFNEGWGQYDTERLVRLVRQLDPTRLVNEASGWHHKGFGDVVDMHKYPGPASPEPEPNRAAVLGEFGGLGLAVQGHTWTNQWWGYRGLVSRESLTRRYVQLLRQVYRLKDDPGLSAAVYTQTTDVERECNGLLTYDRAVLKPDVQTVANANRGVFPPEPKRVVVVPTSEKQPVQWRYTLQKPAEGWFQPDFDDSGWKRGPGGFGKRGTPGAVVRTPWTSSDIWLRREFELKEVPKETLLLRLHHDEDAEVYLNGVLAARARRFTTDYEEVDILPQARQSLRPGRNVLAIHCRQTRGGQYIDAGLVKLVPVEAEQ